MDAYAAAFDTQPASIIQLSPASQTFVDNRTTTLGPWVIGSSLDCVLMGIVLCQVQHFYRNQKLANSTSRFEQYLVGLVAVLSVLKTIQNIAVVWHQNVMDFADPDAARLLVVKAWWQVSTPLATGIIGCIVQTFYAWRLFKLTRKWYFVAPIMVAIVLGLIGVSFSTYYITVNDTKLKVMWLLIHLVSVCVADLLITTFTVTALHRRNTGLAGTVSLIRRLLRMVFEAAVPPAFIATIDLILTQTLGSKLLWHLVLNYALAKLYVISLLFTLNSIGDYRTEQSSDGKLSISHGNGGLRVTRRGDIEMGSQYRDGIQIQTQVSTHISPPSGTPMYSQIHHISPNSPAKGTKSDEFDTPSSGWIDDKYAQ